MRGLGTQQFIKYTLVDGSGESLYLIQNFDFGTAASLLKCAIIYALSDKPNC